VVALIFVVLITLLIAIIYLTYFRPKAKFTKVKIKDLTMLASSDLLDFLEKADDAYILTYETSEIMYFSKYASSAVCHQVLDAIHKNSDRLFGTKKYRKRTWSIIEQKKNEILLRKVVTQKKIEVKYGIKVALGDEIIETWRVSLNPSGYLVEDVS
jgi:hypothetical protein